MLYLIKGLVPKPALQIYHFALAKMSALVYGKPSNRLIIIGVTGTNGKSSSTQFIAQLLMELGETVGYTTTAGFSIAGKDIENKMKMTMPGRMYLQKLIKHMVGAGCSYAIVETSSQGIQQYRHLGINYDVAVFTNLTPEHIEAHGGFQPYKKAKGKLFSHLTKMKHKKINGVSIPKVSVINLDDEHSDFFNSFKADRKVTYSWLNKKSEDTIIGTMLGNSSNGVNVEINGIKTHIALLAKFQHKNALTAIATVYGLGFEIEKVVKAASKLFPLPGRFEQIDLGQDFHVFVDYAYEPYAIKALLESVDRLKPKRIIGVHGSAGGGRDVGRRYKIGKMAAEEEDLVIITNEDPYDEDPRKIIEDVARGARDAGMEEGEDLFLVDDRTQGIKKAIDLAQAGDVVLITGKGSEPVMAVAGGKKIPWNDKLAVIQALKNRGYA